MKSSRRFIICPATKVKGTRFKLKSLLLYLPRFFLLKRTILNHSILKRYPFHCLNVRTGAVPAIERYLQLT